MDGLGERNAGTRSFLTETTYSVIPAKAGIQRRRAVRWKDGSPLFERVKKLAFCVWL